MCVAWNTHAALKTENQVWGKEWGYKEKWRNTTELDEKYQLKPQIKVFSATNGRLWSFILFRNVKKSRETPNFEMLWLKKKLILLKLIQKN